VVTNGPGTTGTPEKTKFKLASQNVGGADPEDMRIAGVAILVALFGVAGFGLVFRGVARLQGLSRH
jgi:hypothetical protein